RTHRCRLRVGVGDSWNGFVVRRTPVAGDVLRDDVALVFADVGQRPDAVDVADRKEALAGAQVVVDRDPVGVGLDTDRLEADSLDARSPTGSHEQPVAPYLCSPVELQDVLVAFFSRRGGVRPEDQLDAVAAQGFAEPLAQRRGLAGKQAVGTL